MHVAMMIDNERLEHERAMLNRLCVGLIGEGTQLTRVVPDTDGADAAEQQVSFAERVEYQARVVPWLKKQRLGSLTDSLSGTSPDILYAVGRGTWPIAPHLAEALNIPLVVDVWSSRNPIRLPRASSGAQHMVYVAATESVARQVSKRLPADSLAVVPIGVAVPSTPTLVFEKADEVISAAIIGRATDVAAYKCCLGALASVMTTYPQMRGFIELEGPREHEVWRMVERLGLLDRVSSITRASAHRKLLAQCDLVLLPERSGEVRTLLLEIMAAGVPVVAMVDRTLDLLIPDKTAAVVNAPTVTAWRERLQQVLQDPTYARKLGEEARAWIELRHRSSKHAEGLLRVFNLILTGGAYSFESPET